ncbi:MAG: serine/threonine protein kinase [Myxococcales bacterium]|nr:serine/threonine protein kinase [Myxococcales bacterium]
MPSDTEPEVFGQYHILEKIATGGMADVYRARLEGAMGFEKILVIKRILDTLAKDEEFKELFQSEARIAALLSHVNIVQVFELGEVNGSLYIAMEHVNGIDLARLASRARPMGEFPVSLALFIVGEVLRALQFAHTAEHEGKPLHVVHCDISPQNVLLSHAGEVKLTDFGISRAAIQKGDQDVIRGKYAYMSPEQVEARPLDGRSDLFSLGIVLYELLTGRRLFKARSRDETLARVRRAEVPSPRGFRPEISEDLEEFLLKTLARTREDRWANASEMNDAIAQLIVREGHRATNNDLAAYLREVSEQIPTAAPRDSQASRRTLAPTPIVVVAMEASPPPRSLATPQVTLAALSNEWTGIIAEADGEIWERGEGAFLVCWTVSSGFRETVARAVRTALALRRCTIQAGYRLSVGVAPGVARIQPDTHRPGDGWELAGPFYLARWMMNLSAHRSRVLLTEVGARQVEGGTSALGRIPIQGNKYINLYEVG